MLTWKSSLDVHKGAAGGRCVPSLCRTRQLRQRSRILAAYQTVEDGLQESYAKGSRLRVPVHKDVVLAVDDSEASEYACAWSTTHLGVGNCTFHLVHCVPSVVPHEVYVTPKGRIVYVRPRDKPVLEEEVLKERQDMIERRFGRYLTDKEVPHQVDMMTGLHADSKEVVGRIICDKVEELRASTVIVASRSEGGLGEFIRGSVASYLTHHCQRPVAVLHAPRHAGQASGVDASAKLRGFWSEVGPAPGHRGIVVAVDDSDQCLKALEWVVGNFYHPGDQLHLMHVVPVIPSTSSYLFAPDGMFYPLPLQLEEVEMEERWWREQLAARFETLLGRLKIPFTFEVVTECSGDSQTSVGHALCERVKKEEVAALVVSTHHKSPLMELLMGSVATYCIHHSVKPVVVLNAPQKEEKEEETGYE